MSRGQQHINGQVSGLLLAGICLFGIAFFTPDAGQPHVGSFFKIAMSSSWHRLFDLAAVWCSLKIILFSIGLFLVIESLGTILARLKSTRLASLVFTMQSVSCLGLLIGGYYFVKALL
jgi:hypothetical protein